MSSLIRDGRPIAELRDFAQARGDLLIADQGIQKLRSLLFSMEDVYRKVLLEEAALDSEGDGGEFAVVVSHEADEDAAADDVGVGALPRATILVVEDEETTRFLLDQILAQAGYRVVTAADGGEALLRLGAGSVDLVLSDIHMPNLDGLKLLEILNQHRMDVPVLLLTGEPSPDVEARGLEMGVAAYMRKPIQRDKLLGQIAEALGESPA
jgi:two-component system chemotaxis response regulator CheY